VTDPVLLDTHIALWLDSGDQRLSGATRALIEGSWRSGGTIYLSAVTGWEIALLVDGGHVALDLPPEAWVERFLDRPGIEAVPLDYRTACRAYQLHHLEHRDPADRLLIGTAIDLACRMVTYDERILSFARRHGRRYGFRVATRP
jgi:PIN domain nuclease of toxin-antitoxin system